MHVVNIWGKIFFNIDKFLYLCMILNNTIKKKIIPASDFISISVSSCSVVGRCLV